MLKLTKGQKMTRNEMKSVAGGVGESCISYCFFFDDLEGPSSSCPANQQCVIYACGPKETGYRCESV
ncbi:hypothetical protein [Pedobacter nototheniae]|uniref:hypothetical protein n=1 Tax=Pedobacter nototheniae TaxID=2488994 RepID=UPI002930E456|nr:hypothetical protein [Pedobacter nototheniae]